MTAHFVNLLDDVRRRSLRMASAVEDVLQEACEAVASADQALARRVINRDADIDAEEIAVESEVIRLMALFQPTGGDIRMLCGVLKINSDLERVADCAVNIAERACHLGRQFSANSEEDLKEFISRVRGVLRLAIQAYSTGDLHTARQVRTEEEAVDALYGQFTRRLIAEATQSPDDMAAYLDILNVGKNLERIADHATNIAEDVIFVATGKIVRHGNQPVE